MEEIRELLEDEVIEEKPVPVVPKKPARKKAVPARAPEALEEIAPKKMTDKEKDNYIEYLRDKLAYANTRIMDLNDACDSAYARTRDAELSSKRVMDSANLKLQLIKDNVSVMANNIMTILEK